MSLKPGTSLSYPNLLRSMFEQVESSLKHLLSYLSSIYQAHGISFDVKPMYNTILRMLTPFELLTFFKLSDPTQLISSINSEKSLQFNNIAPLEVSKPKKERKRNYPWLAQNQQKNKIFSEHDKPSYVSQGGKIIGKNTIYRLSNGGKPALNEKEEAEVCDFIEDQVRKGRVLSMKLIADEAKRIAIRTPYFLASQGWVKNFFVRHPDMRKLYNMSRLNRNANFLPSNFDTEEVQIDQQSKVGLQILKENKIRNLSSQQKKEDQKNENCKAKINQGQQEQQYQPNSVFHEQISYIYSEKQ